jgi:hypothetical protein
MRRRSAGGAAPRSAVALDVPSRAMVQAQVGKREGSLWSVKRRGQAMRNMLALFATALLTAIGLGWYLGWYKVSSQPASVPGQHSVQIDIDTKKISKDLQKGEQKIEQIIKDKAKDEAKSLTDGKKTNDNLMLPSPPPNNSDKKPLFQFHSDNGPSLEIGDGDKGAFIQIGGGDKK